MNQNAIEVSKLRVIYGEGDQRVVALNDIDLKIGTGEFVCAVGPSGCGKTTLLNIIAGFETPQQGVALSADKQITGPGPDRVIMFQDYALFPWLTVSGNIEYGLKRTGVVSKRRAELVRQYIDLISLRGFEDKYPTQLSGGMRQRVALARALVLNPAVLLMDEPFAALDSFTRERMQDELLRIWSREKKAILFITHDIEEAVRLADRVLVMSPRPGRISEEIELPYERPRDVFSERYTGIIRHIRKTLQTSQI